MTRFFRDLSLIVVTVGVTLSISAVWGRWFAPVHRVLRDTPYQAITLANHTVYVGRLDGFGGHFPVLRDVFYIETRENPETKQTVNVLVKRETASHSPTYMVLNVDQILSIEPVGKSSPMAQMIENAEKIK